MTKKRAAGGKRKGAAPEPRREARGIVVVAILGIVLVGTALGVDTRAAAAFDAPKRWIALVGTALAAAVAFACRARDSGSARAWRNAGPPRKSALILAAASLLGALLAALASPRRAVSLDAMRALALLALLLPLGASRAVARGRAWLATIFVGACAVNAAVSILQSRGLFRPFELETVGTRQDTGAYAGNVGYLAIALALASVAAFGILLGVRDTRARAPAGLALCLFAGALLVNQNLTALTALATGCAALLVLRFRRKAALPLAAALAVAALAVVAYAPLRDRARSTVRAARSGDWDAVLSFRGGAWAAALEMIRERPLSGFGPGTFGAEYVPHRLSAEIRARRRFVSPLVTSSYAEAHNDYLQVASDAGVPVAALALGAAACLVAAIARTAWRRKDPEAAVLLAVLLTGAAAALTWFPLQRPVTAVPLLLAAGRAWRISGQTGSDGETP
jgi:O-antigen ligase